MAKRCRGRRAPGADRGGGVRPLRRRPRTGRRADRAEPGAAARRGRRLGCRALALFLGVSAIEGGEHDRAAEHDGQALAAFGALDDRSWMAMTRHQLGVIAFGRGTVEGAAVRWARRSSATGSRGTPSARPWPSTSWASSRRHTGTSRRRPAITGRAHHLAPDRIEGTPGRVAGTGGDPRGGRGPGGAGGPPRRRRRSPARRARDDLGSSRAGGLRAHRRKAAGGPGGDGVPRRLGGG